MTISILMCFKNEAEHLDKTIQSILSQSETNFELIAVDDHSEDKSVEIVQKYQNKDPRIKLFSNQGQGIIDALKTAFSRANGTWITRHDADDLMPSHKLETLKTLLLSHGPGHVSTGYVKYFSDGPLSDGFLKYADWLNSLCKNQNHAQHVFKECVIASPNWMAYKSDLCEINAFQDERYPEDYHLVFKMIEKNLTIVASNQITHLWRDHPKRASRTLEQYKDQKFYDLKTEYFLRFYGDENIIIWGTGPSGKRLVKVFVEKGIGFKWVTNNVRKIGKTIYGIPVKDARSLTKLNSNKIIIAVTQRGSLEGITQFLDRFPGCRYFIF